MSSETPKNQKSLKYILPILILVLGGLAFFVAVLFSKVNSIIDSKKAIDEKYKKAIVEKMDLEQLQNLANDSIVNLNDSIIKLSKTLDVKSEEFKNLKAKLEQDIRNVKKNYSILEVKYKDVIAEMIILKGENLSYKKMIESDKLISNELEIPLIAAEDFSLTASYDNLDMQNTLEEFTDTAKDIETIRYKFRCSRRLNSATDKFQVALFAGDVKYTDVPFNLVDVYDERFTLKLNVGNLKLYPGKCYCVLNYTNANINKGFDIATSQTYYFK